jgi:hypothetical protein
MERFGGASGAPPVLLSEVACLAAAGDLTTKAAASKEYDKSARTVSLQESFIVADEKEHK